MPPAGKGAARPPALKQLHDQAKRDRIRCHQRAPTMPDTTTDIPAHHARRSELGGGDATRGEATRSEAGEARRREAGRVGVKRGEAGAAKRALAEAGVGGTGGPCGVDGARVCKLSVRVVGVNDHRIGRRRSPSVSILPARSPGVRRAGCWRWRPSAGSTCGGGRSAWRCWAASRRSGSGSRGRRRPGGCGSSRRCRRQGGRAACAFLHRDRHAHARRRPVDQRCGGDRGGRGSGRLCCRSKARPGACTGRS
jgi:hypothetical protein